jgi:AcrR family transcriptional regulator
MEGCKMSEKTYHHGNLKNSLIEAGIELINKEGTKNLSLRKVAAMCSVSQAAPYTHFGSKEELLEAMRRYVLDYFMEVLQKAAQSCPDQDNPEVLIKIGKSYVQFFLDNPQYLTFIFSQHCMNVNLDIHGVTENNFPPYQLIKSHAMRILGKMGLPDEKIEDKIIAMWSTVHGLACIATMNNVYYGKVWSDKIEDIIWNK